MKIIEYILNRFFIPFNFVLMFLFNRCLSASIQMSFDLETFKGKKENFEINLYHLQKIDNSKYHKVISIMTLLKFKL